MCIFKSHARITLADIGDCLVLLSRPVCTQNSFFTKTSYPSALLLKSNFLAKTSKHQFYYVLLTASDLMVNGLSTSTHNHQNSCLSQILSAPVGSTQEISKSEMNNSALFKPLNSMEKSTNHGSLRASICQVY